ncbi:unnamed protein product, partial [marine sediment metagenome]
ASVQVHPNDQQAMELENYPMGKTEAWYIIDRTSEAEFYAGFSPGVTKQSVLDALERGAIKDLLQRVNVQPGQCLYVPPGTVHACGNGVLMLEVQQCSDLTYRLCEWEEVGGRARRRRLDLEKALKVIDFEARPSVFQAQSIPNRLNEILSCPSFGMYEITVTGRWAFPVVDAFLAGTLIEGTAVLTGDDAALELTTGESFLMPACTHVEASAEYCRMVITTAGPSGPLLSLS